MGAGACFGVQTQARPYDEKHHRYWPPLVHCRSTVLQDAGRLPDHVGLPVPRVFFGCVRVLLRAVDEVKLARNSSLDDDPDDRCPRLVSIPALLRPLLPTKLKPARI
jgi:hypothetical protein